MTDNADTQCKNCFDHEILHGNKLTRMIIEECQSHIYDIC